MRSHDETIHLIMRHCGVLKYCDVKTSQSYSFEGVDLFFVNKDEGLWMRRQVDYEMLSSPYEILDELADVADYARRAFHTVIAMRKAGVNV